MKNPGMAALLTLACIAQPAWAEMIAVDCKEYVELTDQALPCQVLKTVQIDKAMYDYHLTARKVSNCITAVRARYTEEQCSKAPSLTSESEQEYQCYTETKACEPEQKQAEDSSPQPTVKLWD